MDASTNGSNLVGREACPGCGSRDNLARYSDGHAFCFSVGCGRFEPGDGEEDYQPEARTRVSADLIEANPRELRKRHLSEETCKLFGYGIGSFKGSKVQAATYRDQEGRPVAQKIRFPDKEEGMPWVGSPKGVQLFGQHLWSEGGRKIVITEGEIDAMSLSQVQGNKWPTVSLINGAGGAKRDLAANLQYLSSFEEIILMFDMDEPGQAAVQEAAKVLPMGKVKIASLPLKDASDCLVAGKTEELTRAIWNAKSWSPDGIVSVSDIREEAAKPIEMGLPWVFPSLTEITYGRRHKEIYAIGAGTGVGKTDFLTEQISFDVTELRQSVGVIMLEQKPTETLKRLAGKIMNRRFHVPDGGWTQEELTEGIDRLDGWVHFYDSFGETEWDVVENQVRYMATSLGHRLVYIDHLTAMADTANERESLEHIMKEMASLANELDIVIHFVSHLSTPEGKPHEEGGRVTIRHFKGSRAIGFWSYYMFGLERDQQADDEEQRSTTTFRVLKDRYTGQSTGKTIRLGYDPETGRMFEKGPEEEPDEFEDETGDDDIPF